MPKIEYKNADGQPLQGVTTILGNLGWNSGALIGWAYGRGKKGLPLRDQQSLDIGTLAHKLIESDLKGNAFKLPELSETFTKEMSEKVDNCFLAYLEWRDSFKFELAAQPELSLVSEEYQYGGTIDIPATIKGLPSILDIKTTEGGITYPDQKIQIRAYAQLWNENFPDKKIQSYYIFNPGKSDGGFHHHYWPSLDDEWEVFKHLLEINRLKKKLGA